MPRMSLACPVSSRVHAPPFTAGVECRSRPRSPPAHIRRRSPTRRRARDRHDTSSSTPRRPSARRSLLHSRTRRRSSPRPRHFAGDRLTRVRCGIRVSQNPDGPHTSGRSASRSTSCVPPSLGVLLSGILRRHTAVGGVADPRLRRGFGRAVRRTAARTSRLPAPFFVRRDLLKWSPVEHGPLSADPNVVRGSAPDRLQAAAVTLNGNSRPTRSVEVRGAIPESPAARMSLLENPKMALSVIVVPVACRRRRAVDVNDGAVLAGRPEFASSAHAEKRSF